MSSDNPRWLEELAQELGLDSTPEPVEEQDAEISLLDAIKRLDFTARGWAHVRDLILEAEEEGADASLLRRLMSESADNAMLFTAMIGLPYALGRTIGYAEEYLEKLTTFVAASYVIAMHRGYAFGQEDAKAQD